MGIYGSNTYVYFTDYKNSQFIIHLRVCATISLKIFSIYISCLVGSKKFKEPFKDGHNGSGRNLFFE